MVTMLVWSVLQNTVLLCSDSAGAEKVMKHALQLLNVAQDGTARVAVLRDFLRHCLPEHSEKRETAVARVQAYSNAIEAHSGSVHQSLLKWGLGPDEV
jgi:hypothetical protein